MFRSSAINLGTHYLGLIKSYSCYLRYLTFLQKSCAHSKWSIRIGPAMRGWGLKRAGLYDTYVPAGSGTGLPHRIMQKGGEEEDSNGDGPRSTAFSLRPRVRSEMVKALSFPTTSPNQSPMAQVPKPEGSSRTDSPVLDSAILISTSST